MKQLLTLATILIILSAIVLMTSCEQPQQSKITSYDKFFPARVLKVEINPDETQAGKYLYHLENFNYESDKFYSDHIFHPGEVIDLNVIKTNEEITDTIGTIHADTIKHDKPTSMRFKIKYEIDSISGLRIFPASQRDTPVF